MHVKSDSEVTSIDASSPPRSPRRPLYYVQSPSHHDVEKMSYGSSPMGSPSHHYHCSPIHHSRESSTSRFSASLKQPRNPTGWKKLHQGVIDNIEDEEDVKESGGNNGNAIRFYIVCFVLSFIVLFSVFSLILWGASKAYKPDILVQSIVFDKFNIQAGIDNTGVPTDMLSVTSTVRIYYKNTGTFFGVHVTSNPLELYYYQLRVASGHMDKFYVSRKGDRRLAIMVRGNQVPLYGGISVPGGAKEHLEKAQVPLNLTFRVQSRAYVLGKLVKPKFYRNIRCPVLLRGDRLGKHQNLIKSCLYED
ncbi:Late embryogenesis abundant protein, LEA_2 subgroup [Dillenia turbinata]|uniref:Late embryogenesis abundant protein, LEA_2 subgroup n=1 Tax=Dillenia turbinata TaxID=194707 RepID=A0AAN8YYD2_9MAGN